MCPIMGGGNVNMWHECTSQINCNIIDYGCMYDVYKLLYKLPIFNSLAIIIQLNDFLKW
jgi:hypothetical protein